MMRVLVNVDYFSDWHCTCPVVDCGRNPALLVLIADYRSVSVTPILSRVAEKLVVSIG